MVQGVGGQIEGRVVDGQALTIPKATVILSNELSGGANIPEKAESQLGPA
jgi:hypothetical protein